MRSKSPETTIRNVSEALNADSFSRLSLVFVFYFLFAFFVVFRVIFA